MSDKKSNRLSETLDRACSLEAFKNNVRREYHAGKTAQGTQHVAIALSVLKRSCGVDSDDRMTPKEIVAAGQKKTEDNIQFGNEPKPRSPFRCPAIDRSGIEGVPIHRRAKSGNEQPFIDPENFMLTASGTVKKKKSNKNVKSNKEEIVYPSLAAWLVKILEA